MRIRISLPKNLFLILGCLVALCGCMMMILGKIDETQKEQFWIFAVVLFIIAVLLVCFPKIWCISLNENFLIERKLWDKNEYSYKDIKNIYIKNRNIQLNLSDNTINIDTFLVNIEEVIDFFKKKSVKIIDERIKKDNIKDLFIVKKAKANNVLVTILFGGSAIICMFMGLVEWWIYQKISVLYMIFISIVIPIICICYIYYELSFRIIVKNDKIIYICMRKKHEYLINDIKYVKRIRKYTSGDMGKKQQDYIYYYYDENRTKLFNFTTYDRNSDKLVLVLQNVKPLK